jgi:hypothetical protein
MHRFVTLLIITVFLTISGGNLYAQKEKSQSPKAQAKEQARLRKEREDKIDKEIKAKEDQHKTIQDKPTQKRMKRTAKKSKKLAKGRQMPFYKRWFKK